MFVEGNPCLQLEFPWFHAVTFKEY